MYCWLVLCSGMWENCYHSFTLKNANFADESVKVAYKMYLLASPAHQTFTAQFPPMPAALICLFPPLPIVFLSVSISRALSLTQIGAGFLLTFCFFSVTLEGQSGELLLFYILIAFSETNISGFPGPVRRISWGVAFGGLRGCRLQWEILGKLLFQLGLAAQWIQWGVGGGTKRYWWWYANSRRVLSFVLLLLHSMCCLGLWLSTISLLWPLFPWVTLPAPNLLAPTKGCSHCLCCHRLGVFFICFGGTRGFENTMGKMQQSKSFPA